MDIDQMQAGTKLDLLMAGVMGWPDTNAGPDDDTYDAWLDAQPYPQTYTDDGALMVWRDDTDRPGEPWSPSTNIAHAMEVAAAMKRKGHAFHLYSPTGNSAFEASFYPAEITMGANGPTPELAICRAALRAVGAK